MKPIFSFLLLLGIIVNLHAQEWMIARPTVFFYKMPATSGESTGMPGIGTRVKVVEKSKNGKFLKVSQDKGITGWVTTAQLISIDKLSPKVASLAVIRAYMSNPHEGGEENAEVEKWVKNLKSDKTLTITEQVELELYRLLIIQRIARTIQPDSNEWKTWIARRNDLLYNTDFGNAGYFLKAEYLWKLESSLAANEPLKERIAYEAGKLETGGECEGYWVCVLERAMSKAGEYLKRHPKGKNAPAVVQSLQEEFQNMDTAEIKNMEAGDQKIAKKLATEWKAVLAKAADSPAKKQLLIIFNKV